MLYREIFRILGNYLLYLALILCLPLGVALYYEYISLTPEYDQLHCSLQFLETIFITVILAFIFRFIGRNASHQIFRREGIVIAVGIWLITSCIAATPYYLTKTLDRPVDAFFEAMSGLTTTGASLLTPKAYNDAGQEIPITITNEHVPNKVYTYYGTITPVKDADGKILASGMQAVSKAVLFWRSFTQWIGGMGIVVLFLTVLPALGVGGKILFQAEVPGPVKETITPRLRDTASLLWKIYFGVTLLQIILLLWTNQQMPIFDSVCIAFSTLSTGGFTVVDNSIASYHNAATDWVIIAFMIIGSINFSLYFHIIRGKFYRIYSPDFFLFITSVIVGSVLVSAYVIGIKTYSLGGNVAETYDLSTAIRQGAFQSISAQTSTGFSTANYDLWPFPSQMFMLLLMFFGGMSGATCGGIKTTRFYILYKILVHRIEAIFRPDTVRKLKIGSSEIDPSKANTVMAFFCIALFSVLVGTVSYIMNGIDPETSLGLVACMLNNIGMAFRAAGPANAFNFMSDFSKLMSSFWMLLGRLEFFAILLLFIPSFWKSK